MMSLGVSPDQTVENRAAAGEEPGLGGGASRGPGQQRLWKAVPHGGRPAPRTGPGAEAETEDKEPETGRHCRQTAAWKPGSP